MVVKLMSLPTNISVGGWEEGIGGGTTDEKSCDSNRITSNSAAFVQEMAGHFVPRTLSTANRFRTAELLLVLFESMCMQLELPYKREQCGSLRCLTRPSAGMDIAARWDVTAAIMT